VVKAKVEEIGEIVEEEVTLLIDGIEIVCFASICPYVIEEGETYPVSLTLAIFSDYDLHESGDEKSSLCQIGNSFSYVITGFLSDGILDAGIKFFDEVFLSNFGYLDGKMASIRVDRIDVEFLES
jgi:hypothetical protein